MRQQIRNMVAVGAVAMMALAVSCSADDADFAIPEGGGSYNPGEGNPDGGEMDDDGTTGVLSLDDLMLYVDVDNEDLSNDDYLVDQETKAGEADTRVEADGDYRIIIIKETTSTDGTIESKEVFNDTYESAMSIMEGLELPVGHYVLEARSYLDKIELVGTKPEYETKKRYEFSIGKDKETFIDEDVICRLANVKTSVNMAVDLLANFNHSVDDETGVPLTITIKLGEASYTYTREEIESEDFELYYAPSEASSTMEIILNGEYNTAPADQKPDYTPVTWSSKIDDVQSGQYRVVNINYANYNDGMIHIEFNVSSWVSGGTIGVDSMNGTFYTKSEGEILDPDDFVSDAGSPVVTLGGDLNIENIYELTPESFDEGVEDDDTDDSYTPEYKLVITPEAEASVKSVKLKVALATNTDFSLLLAEAGYDSEIVLWDADGEADETLAKYMTTKVGDDGVVTIDMLYAGARLFGDYYGAYKFKLTVEDDKARESNTLLSINSSTLGFEWKSGDFATRYDIWTDDDAASLYPGEEMINVKFDITSATGITAMKIKMVSKILTDSVLGVMSLATEMDLVNPESAAMESALKGLGFPVGSDIENQKAMVFDISQFMPMLALLSPSGSGDETDFVITVEDASGSLTKTLMLKRR